MTNTWTVNSDGSVTFSGTVQFPAGTNLATGAGVAIFGPNGGATNFGVIAKGDNGLSPTFTVSMIQVADGTALPSPNPAVAFTPGSGSVPDAYALTFYVNAGAAGASGSTVLLTATDLEGTAAQGYMIGYNTTDAKAQWQAIPYSNYYYAGSIAATASNTSAQKNMTSVLVDAQKSAWWPKVSAQAQVIGASDTRVDLVARINSTTGTVCGYGLGTAGASPPPVAAFEQGLAVGSANIIPAGVAATIFLNAENQTASPNPWSVAAGAWIQVKPEFVPL